MRSVASLFGDNRHRLYVLLVFFMLSAQPGKSDTIVINDLTDVITVTDIGGNDTIDINCSPLNAELCVIDITRPGSEMLFGTTFTNNLLEPVDHRISDEISGEEAAFNQALQTFVYEIKFDSFENGIGAGSSSGIVESGQPQDTDGFIRWITGGMLEDDHIQVESKVDSITTPEPSTLALLGSVLFACCDGLYRRTHLRTGVRQ